MVQASPPSTSSIAGDFVMLPYFNITRQNKIMMIFNMMYHIHAAGTVDVSGAAATIGRVRGGSGTGAAAGVAVECLQIMLYNQALNINFYNIKKQALRAAPAPERGGSESIDGSCGGAVRAVVAAGAAVAGGARRGATQARRAPHRRIGRPTAAGTRQRPVRASRRSAGALRGAAAYPLASHAPAAAPRAAAARATFCEAGGRRRLAGVGHVPAEALASAETHQNLCEPCVFCRP